MAFASQKPKLLVVRATSGEIPLPILKPNLHLVQTAARFKRRNQSNILVLTNNYLAFEHSFCSLTALHERNGTRTEQFCIFCVFVEILNANERGGGKPNG